MAVDVNIQSGTAAFQGNPARPAAINLQTAAGATATVAGATLSVSRAPENPAGIVARVRLTAVNAGTPTLDADVEDSWDGTNWNTLVSFAQLTGVGEETLALSRVPAPFIRSNGVIGGGTPDIDFRVDILGLEAA